MLAIKCHCVQEGESSLLDAGDFLLGEGMNPKPQTLNLPAEGGTEFRALLSGKMALEHLGFKVQGFGFWGLG